MHFHYRGNHVYLCFPSFQSRSVSSSENSGGGGHRIHSRTQVANSTMVADTNENSYSKSPETASEKGADISAKPTRLNSSATPKASIYCFCHVSRNNSKLTNYKSRLQPLSWTDCETVQKRNMSLISKDGGSTAVKGKWIPLASVETGVNFLTELYQTGVE